MKLFKRFYKGPAGFSLVEIMVVIGITLILTTMSIGFSRSSQTQLEGFRNQSEVVGVINRAKSLTLERFSESGVSGRDVCGIGIRFANNNQDYFLFQDLALSGDCSSSDKEYSGSSEDLEAFSLSPRVSFGSIPSDLEILFLAPHLDTISSEGFPIDFTIELDGESISMISISAVGQVSIQEVSS
ncbi:MAG: prepilin-type N-terminal cleavage/methylation domain-containing protein [Candidatus Paceibacterota bacterium]